MRHPVSTPRAWSELEGGVTAALHTESCVRCGLCADACQFSLGFELIELQDHGLTGYCYCGGGGGVVSNQRATPLRHKVFELKKQQVQATGAKHFVTRCGQSRITLDMGPSTHGGTSRPEACSSSWPTTLPTEDLAMRRSMFAAIVRPIG